MILCQQQKPKHACTFQGTEILSICLISVGKVVQLYSHINNLQLDKNIY